MMRRRGLTAPHGGLSSQGDAAAGLGRLTGLDGSQSSNLLRLLAPIVMGMLAKRATAGNLDAGGLGSLLGQAGGGDVGDMLAGSLLRGGR